MGFLSSKANRKLTSKICNICGIALIALASFYNSTLLILLSVALIVFGSSYSTKGFFIGGIIFHVVAFYWLPETLVRFGGFPNFLGFILLIIFAVISAGQFLLTAKLYNNIKIQAGCFALPLAWTSVDFLTPKLFPWSICHPTIESKLLNIPASIGSYQFASFFLILFFTAGYDFLKYKRVWGFIPFLIYLLPFCIETKQEINLPPIGIIQSNINPFNPSSNKSLKSEIENLKTDLVILPESADNTLISAEAPSHSIELFEYASFNKNLIFGGIQGKSPNMLQNTAFYIDTNYKILGRYSKIILMPFGEYLPFEYYFPWLRDLSPESGNFIPGKIIDPFSWGKYKFSIIICYEDLIPAIALINVRNGADFLVNLTNDMWYGTSFAASQHDLLARWRSIELGVPIIRVTNTGLSSVTDSSGSLVTSLDEHKRVSKIIELKTLNKQTIFRTAGFYPLWIITLITFFILCSSFKIKLKKR